MEKRREQEEEDEGEEIAWLALMEAKGSAMMGETTGTPMDEARYRRLVEIDGGHETVVPANTAKGTLQHHYKVIVGEEPPSYETRSSGPPHMRAFDSSVDVTGLALALGMDPPGVVKGFGRSHRKVESENLAAVDAIRLLKTMGLLDGDEGHGRVEEGEDPKVRFNELYQARHGCNHPPYRVSEDSLGRGGYIAEVHVYGRAFRGKGRSKMEATRSAASKALDYMGQQALPIK